MTAGVEKLVASTPALGNSLRGISRDEGCRKGVISKCRFESYHQHQQP